MAVNLVSLISQVLTPQLIGSLARMAGLNEAVAQKLAAAAIPTVLAALASMAAAPGGAQKLADAVSNSDPDTLGKLSSAISSGDMTTLGQGANLIGGLLGGSALSTLAGALSQYAGAPPQAAQTVIGAVAHAVLGVIGQQDPSNWSDASSIAALFNSQKSAISAALPPELLRALGATGLLAGLGGLGAAAAQPAGTTASPVAGAASAAANRARPIPTPPAPAPAPPPAPRSTGFPMWAIIVVIVIVLAAIWWYISENHKQPEPAKQGMLPPPVEFAIGAPVQPRT